MALMELVDEEQDEYLESMEQTGTAQTLLTGQDGPPPLVEIAPRWNRSTDITIRKRASSTGTPRTTSRRHWRSWMAWVELSYTTGCAAKHCVNTYRDGNSSSTRQPSTK